MAERLRSWLQTFSSGFDSRPSVWYDQTGSACPPSPEGTRGLSPKHAFRDVAQSGRALALGARGRRFESCYPDSVGGIASRTAERSEVNGRRTPSSHPLRLVLTSYRVPQKPQEIPEDERVYIPEAAQLLDRRIGTLRRWEADGVLPANLMPLRGKRSWRYWSREQIDLIQQWMIDTDRRPGRALPHISSDPAKVEQQIHAMRRPRRKRKPVARTPES